MMDLNGDGDIFDMILRYYDISKSKLVNTGVEMSPFGFDVSSSIIAVLTQELTVGMDLNGDGDTSDLVARYFDIPRGMVVNTKIEVAAGTSLTVRDNLIILISDERYVGPRGTDLNGDEDTDDNILRYYDVSTKQLVNTGLEISSSVAHSNGKIIAFATDEARVVKNGKDLNGDGDINDRIVRYYDLTTGIGINTQVEMWSLDLGISDNIIAFGSAENRVGRFGEDLNGDGDKLDIVLRYIPLGPILPPPPTASFTASPSPAQGDAPLTVQFTDTSTNNPTSWSWDFDNNGSVDSTLQNPSHTYTTAGDYTVSLTVSNQAGSDTKTIPNLIRVTAPDTTAPVVSISEPLDNAVVKDTIIIKATATDDKGVNRVEFYIDNILHSADNTSPYEYSWDTKTVLDGAHSLKAKAYDEAGNSREDNITVRVNNTPPPLNHPPVFNPIGNQTIDEGQELRFTISASDPEGDALTYSAGNLPSGASFNPLTRVFSWTLDNNQSGTYPNIHFEVSDGKSTDFENITITVNDVVIPPPPPVNHPPVANAGSDQTVESNSYVQLSASASFDPDHDPLTYQWTQISGQTVSLQNSNQAIAGFTAPEVTIEQSLEFQLMVRDPDNLSSSDTAIIAVKPKPIVQPTIQITEPQNNGIVIPRSKVTITANVQDSGNRVKNVSFLVNHKTYRASKNRQGAYSYHWTVPYGYSKTYIIQTQAKDRQRNIVANDSIAVSSSQSPRISLTEPQNNQTIIPKTSIPITANLSPNNIGITKVEFYINNQRKHTDRNFPYSYSWRVPKETNQTYNIQAKAFTRDEEARTDVLIGEDEVVVRVE